nr:EF-hand calcium-binding domain-containing protein 4B isoform X2 [Kogia breviceps]
MATPDRGVVSRPRGPGWGHHGSGACPGPLDDEPCEGAQELAPAQLTMLRKAQEFFQTCDAEGKGFIARRDMQRLHKELPLSREDLEAVFDALDADGNGFLTPAEFTTGFRDFFFGQHKPREEDTGEHLAQLREEKVYQTRGDADLGDVDEEEEAQFHTLMDRLGAQELLEDENDVKQLWLQLKKDEPHLLSDFEDFLTRIFSQLLEAHEEKKELECALKKKIAAYDEEIQHLYEEMEQQITSEKEQFLLKDTERFQACSQKLERKLLSKEQEAEQLIQKQKRLEGQCTALHNDKHETKAENTKLRLTNQELARELERVSWELQDAQQQLESLQHEARKLHQEKEMEVYRSTESLQREKSGLLKQLDFLRERNKHLRDERDICFQKDQAAKANTAACKASQKQRSGSVIGKYVDDGGMPRSRSEEEEDVFGVLRGRSSPGLSGHPLTEEGPGARLRRIISIEEDPLPQLLGGGFEQPPGKCPEEGEASDQGLEGPTGSPRPLGLTPASPRGQPAGRETPSKEEGSVSTPDRIFKIVLVGNSSVGKTSFLSRFCDGRFSPGAAATVGIDYRMKTVRVDDWRVALQLWDTAGQERYRSITQQFFRKADGVVVLYDLTARQSFLAVRPWLSSVEEHNLIFYECSAYSGHNTQESVLHLARILKEQEDTVREDTIQIDLPAKKKACCG